MAESGDLKTINVDIGTMATADGTIPVMYIPASHGAISITSAYLYSLGAAGTVLSAYLCKLTNAVVPLAIAAGTLGTLPTSSGTLAACGARAFTVATKIVSPGTAGCFLGMKFVGTIVSPAGITVNYVQGRDG